MLPQEVTDHTCSGFLTYVADGCSTNLIYCYCHHPFIISVIILTESVGLFYKEWKVELEAQIGGM